MVHQGGDTVEPLAADQVGGDWIVFRAALAREGVVRLEITAERQTGLEYADWAPEPHRPQGGASDGVLLGGRWRPAVAARRWWPGGRGRA
ncbi:hypothetical protein, partial [Nonomuraea sp. NPDC003201]